MAKTTTRTTMTTSQRWTLVATVLASGVVFLDSTVVNVALPRIGQELSSNVFGVLEAQSYVYNGYLLSLSSLLVLAGALSDYYGRKKIYAIGLWGFGLTSVLCGFAPTMDWLIVGRVLQGVAGALLVPGSLALIGSSFPEEDQGRAFGIWSASSAAMTLLGPLVGGALVDTLGWRVGFLINVPLLLVSLYALRHIPESKNEAASSQFDYVGAFVIALAVGGLAFGGIFGQERNWQDPLAFIALAVGAVATLVFIPLMRRSKNPLVPLTLFTSRNFAVINLSTFLIYGALYVSGYYQAIFFQGTLDYSALAAGAVNLPVSVLLTLFSARVGSLVKRLGLRFFLTLGPFLMALGLAWLLRLPGDSTAWTAQLATPSTLWPSLGYWRDVFPAIVLYALGLTLLVAPLTTGLMASVPKERTGLGSAINNAVSRVGPQLAGALIFVLITTAFYSNLAARTNSSITPELRQQLAPLNKPADNVDPILASAARASSLRAFHLAMGACVVLLVAGAIVNGVGLTQNVKREM
ncbi:MAG: MFS transporter [Trueperaceae bacterium]